MATILNLILKHINCILANNFDNFDFNNSAVLIKRWDISFDDAFYNPNHRFQLDNIIVHPQYDVSICYLLVAKLLYKY